MLISANIGVWVAWQVVNPRFMQNHFAISDYSTVRARRYYTIWTSSVSHKEPIHLLFNCVGIYFFGPFAEAMLGPVGFLGLYAAGAFGAYQSIYHTYRRKYRTLVPVTVGASGAVSAIFTYFICVKPWEPILFWFIPMPAIAAGAIIMFLGSRSSGRGGISHEGHMGGAIAGAAYYFARKLFFKY